MNKFVRIIASILVLFLVCLSAWAQGIERVSVSSNGVQGNNESYSPSISADGRFVAFGSDSSNLVAGDTNDGGNIFVHDSVAGVTERVDVSSSGVQGNRQSYNPSISADGRFVAFNSVSSNLVADDTNDEPDIFVHDREIGVIERVNVSSSGVQGNRQSYNPSISADGRFVAFNSVSSNLVAGDTNDEFDIFVHDRATGVTERVSVSSSGVQGNRQTYNPSISADGRFVAFESDSSNLVAGDTNDEFDIFVYDRETGVTERVSVSSSNVQASYNSRRASISADGRFVAFESDSSNLVAGDTNGGRDIFVHDRETGVTERVSVSSSGGQGNRESVGASISADGRFVAFQSYDTNLVADDTNNHYDTFVHDRATGVTERVSLSWSGEQGNSYSGIPSISADGRFVGFDSWASNLVDGDTNDWKDVFITENSLIAGQLEIELLINNAVRFPYENKAELLIGTNLKLDVSVTNNTPNRLYNVKVFSECNFYTLNPGESKRGCTRFQPVEINGRFLDRTVTAKISGSSTVLSATSGAYYFGHSNTQGELSVTHRVNNINADAQSQAPTLNSGHAEILYKVENTGKIELYKVNAYYDPVSPVNSGWVKQCSFGRMEPGQVRYCKRNITLTNTGLNKVMGRVQALNGNLSHTAFVNAANPTYFIVP